MPDKLTRFKIEGLHNARTVDIPIEDNKLILVGENGTGKSTVSNLLYYLLTAQWQRLLEYTFKSISVVIGSENYEFRHNEIVDFMEFVRFTSDNDPHIHSLKQINLISSANFSMKLLRQTASKSVSDSFLNALEDTSLNKNFKDWPIPIADQILYLPTYRRIEQDLKRVLPHLDINKHQRQRRRLVQSNLDAKYIELVEFGMQDVVRAISQKTTAIKEKVRSDLSHLTGEYLRDIIQGAYRHVNPSNLSGLDGAKINDIFGRIPSDILPEMDKSTLRKIIAEINTTGEIEETNKVVAHFLIKLAELYTNQQKDEKDIREFVRVCNEGYLSGKKLIYDDTTFDVSIVQDDATETSKSLTFQSLSSGEKQIVSLFSHLYLSGKPSFFMIIDEPELSLSVLWQQRLLPDILERCNGLIAVTHSPFIFDNDLQTYTHSLEEFTQPFEYDSTLENLRSYPFFPLEEEIPF